VAAVAVVGLAELMVMVATRQALGLPDLMVQTVPGAQEVVLPAELVVLL